MYSWTFRAGWTATRPFPGAHGLGINRLVAALLSLAAVLILSTGWAGASGGVFPADCYSWAKVANGSTCSSIAARAGVSVAQLASLNPGLNCSALVPNTQVCLGWYVRVLESAPMAGAVKYLLPPNGDQQFAIKYVGASNRTELHVAPVAGNSDSYFAMRLPTALPWTSPATFQFLLGTNEDLYAVNLTDPSRPQLLVLPRARAYATISLRVRIALPATALKPPAAAFQFQLDSANNLFALGYAGSASTASIFMLSAASNYSRVSFVTSAPLANTSPLTHYLMLGANNDVYLYKYTGVKSMEVSVLSSSSSYQSFTAVGAPLSIPRATAGEYQLLYTAAQGVVAFPNGAVWATELPATAPTSGPVQYLMSANQDLYAVKYNGSTSTELYALSAASNYKTLVLQTSLGIPKTSPSTFQFLFTSNDDLLVVNLTEPRVPSMQVLSKSSGYRNTTLHTKLTTPLNITYIDDAKALTFLLGTNDDLYVVVNWAEHELRNIELLVLPRSANYTRVDRQYTTAWAASNVPSYWMFMGPDNSLQAVQLYAYDCARLIALYTSNGYDWPSFPTVFDEGEALSLPASHYGSYQFVAPRSNYKAVFAIPSPGFPGRSCANGFSCALPGFDNYTSTQLPQSPLTNLGGSIDTPSGPLFGAVPVSAMVENARRVGGQKVCPFTALTGEELANIGYQHDLDSGAIRDAQFSPSVIQACSSIRRFHFCHSAKYIAGFVAHDFLGWVRPYAVDIITRYKVAACAAVDPCSEFYTLGLLSTTSQSVSFWKASPVSATLSSYAIAYSRNASRLPPMQLQRLWDLSGGGIGVMLSSVTRGGQLMVDATGASSLSFYSADMGNEVASIALGNPSSEMQLAINPPATDGGDYNISFRLSGPADISVNGMNIIQFLSLSSPDSVSWSYDLNGQWTYKSSGDYTFQVSTTVLCDISVLELIDAVSGIGAFNLNSLNDYGYMHTSSKVGLSIYATPQSTYMLLEFQGDGVPTLSISKYPDLPEPNGEYSVLFSIKAEADEPIYTVEKVKIDGEVYDVKKGLEATDPRRDPTNVLQAAIAEKDTLTTIAFA